MQDRVRRLDDHHIDARSHGLLRRRVAEVEHLVDHALLFVIELVVVGHDVADLLLGDVLAIRSARPSLDGMGRYNTSTVHLPSTGVIRLFCFWNEGVDIDLSLILSM